MPVELAEVVYSSQGAVEKFKIIISHAILAGMDFT
jgi:hypothetical protein